MYHFNYVKVYSFVELSTFTLLCNHHRQQKFFIFPN